MRGVSEAIADAIDIVGLSPLARACGVTYQAVRKWERQGRLPRTEWTGETRYAVIIEEACDGNVSVDELAPGLSAVLAAQSHEDDALRSSGGL